MSRIVRNLVMSLMIAIIFSVAGCGGGGESPSEVEQNNTPAQATGEMEPNDSPVTATTLPAGTMMNGQLSSELDQDWYIVTTESAGTFSVTFTGTGTYSGNGNGWSISILDSANNVLASTRVYQGTNLQQTIHMGIGIAGVYYVMVQSPVSVLGRYSSNNYTLNLSHSAGTKTGEMEANDSLVTATTLPAGTMMNGQLSSELDQDWYKVTAESAGTLSVTFTGTGTYSGSGNGWLISILDSASNVLASTRVYQGTNLQQTIHAGVGIAGVYYVMVQSPVSVLGMYSYNNYTVNVSAP